MAAIATIDETSVKPTILIVSVPDHQQYALCRYAELAGYSVIAVGHLSGFDWRLPLDLIVCEHRAPQMDAAKLCRYMRRHSSVPILAVVSTPTLSLLPGILDAGADVCLASPYDADDFIACLRAILRRSRRPQMDSIHTLQVGDFQVIPEALRCAVHGREVRLSTQEFRLLFYLVQNPYRLLSHDELVHAIWGAACTHKAEFLRPVVMSLRKKLETDWKSPCYIRTAHKGGYFFVPSAIGSETRIAIALEGGDIHG